MLHLFWSIKRSYFAKILVVLLLSNAGVSHAAHLSFNGSTAIELRDTIINAGDGGSVTLTKDLIFTQSVPINVANMTIRGANKTITESGNFDVFVVNQPNVRLVNLRFIGQTGGKFRAFINPKASNLTVQNCFFQNGSGGIRTVGEPPKGLQVLNNTFESVPTGIAINRDVVRVSGVNQVNRALDGGSIQITGNTLRNSAIAAITIDAGNDGGVNANGSLAGQGDPRFPEYDSPLRTLVNGQVTDYFSSAQIRSSISNNTISGVQGFGIALARVNGFNILNNSIHIADTGKAFRRAIHVENRTNGITIATNTIELSGGTGNPSAIGMVTFTDYGNPSRFVNGTRRIDILNNIIKGTGRGIVGNGFAKVSIQNNNLDDLVGDAYSFFNASGGANEIIASSGNNPIDP